MFGLHVLIGLREIPGAAQDILVKEGLVDAFEKLPPIRKEYGKAPWAKVEGELEKLMVIWPGVLAAMDEAVDASRKNKGSGIVETEHVLYALLLRDDEAHWVLNLAGVNSESVLEQARARIESKQ